MERRGPLGGQRRRNVWRHNRLTSAHPAYNPGKIAGRTNRTQIKLKPNADMTTFFRILPQNFFRIIPQTLFRIFPLFFSLFPLITGKISGRTNEHFLMNISTDFLLNISKHFLMNISRLSFEYFHRFSFEYFHWLSFEYSCTSAYNASRTVPPTRPPTSRLRRSPHDEATSCHVIMLACLCNKRSSRH